MRRHATEHPRDRESPRGRVVDVSAAREPARVDPNLEPAARASAAGLMPARILSIQRAAGNATVAEMLAGAREPGGVARPGHARSAEASVQQTGETATDSTLGTTTEVLGTNTTDDQGANLAGTGVTTSGTSSTTFGPPTSSTYSVSGSLLEAANAIAARTEAGLTTSTPSLDTDTLNDKVTAARVTIAEDVQLPVWTDRATANTQQQAEWDRFQAAIAAHEAGHVQRDRASWANAHAKLVGKSSADASTAFERDLSRGRRGERAVRHRYRPWQEPGNLHQPQRGDRHEGPLTAERRPRGLPGDRHGGRGRPPRTAPPWNFSRGDLSALRG